MGKAKHAFSQDVLKAATHENEQHQPEYKYYPSEWFEPYLARRRAVGYDLYDSLGIKKEDRIARTLQEQRNYEFFDAPVGLLITLDRKFNTGSYMDLGMFIQNILLCARGKGLHTCAQAAFAWYHEIARRHVPIGENHILACGIALGYEDTNAPENHLNTAREKAANFSTFHGY